MRRSNITEGAAKKNDSDTKSDHSDDSRPVVNMQVLLCGLCGCFLLFSLQCTAQEKAQPSTRSQLVYKTLDIANLNERIFEKLLDDPPRGKEAVSVEKLHSSLFTEERNVDGFGMLTITASQTARKHIFFLHGGAYVAEASSGHRKLIETLARDYGYRVTFIDYPLAPEHDILTCLEVLEQAYRLLVQEYDEDVFCLMGDSAGGGLALTFLQRLRDNGMETRPEKTILFSPWLDVGMTNPGIDTLVEKDVLLHKEGLIACGKMYAGGLELDDPRLSPIYGDLHELSQIKVFVSAHELFYPDCILLLEKAAAAQNTYVDLTVKERMVHDWVILPLRERDEALKEVAVFF
jgi:monoterpene epsilon-lactone hydrolase